MNSSTILRSRATSIAAGSLLLVALGGVSAAVAAGGHGHAAAPGASHGQGHLNTNWGIVDRNVIGNGDSYLRSGPTAASADGLVAPPLGTGSLGLRTGSPDDAANFGDQVDYAGDALSELSTVTYSVFVTAEDQKKGPAYAPNVKFEIDPDGPAADVDNYSTLVFVPESPAVNAWTSIDASKAQRWYLTGTAGTTSGCNQTTYCTLGQVQTAYSDATIYTVELGKGRDQAFSGAVDALRINDTVYDFEATGVYEGKAK